jgi:hypothetical protein
MHDRKAVSCPNSDGPGSDLGGTVRYTMARPMKTTPSTTATLESNLLEFIARVSERRGRVGTRSNPRRSFGAPRDGVSSTAS